MPRNRLLYLALILITIACGLLSRSSAIPDFLYPYLGDVLYATMSVFIVGFLFPKIPTNHSWMWAYTCCLFVELSQLYQGDWLNSVRATKIGALVLGSGFLWSDLVAYLAGALVGGLIDGRITRRTRKKDLAKQ